jgi:hypothetical protein
LVVFATQTQEVVMKRAFTFAVLLLFIGLMSAQPSTEASSQNGSEWTTLLDGSTLDGWNVLGAGTWMPKDGAVEGDGEAGYLVTADSYGDFQLTMEFWIEAADSNSGVFIRCSDPNDIGAGNCYEVNIADMHDNPDNRSGGIVGLVGPSQAVSTGGKWNTFDITARGDQLTVVLNGVTTVDAQDGEHASGAIALQHRAGKVTFQNVRIRKL